MKVGTIVKLKVACLGNEKGTLGVVFYDYGDGFQVIFENGNYDGFSIDEEITRTGTRIEADYFLEEVGFEESLASYQFTNVIQVCAAYRRGLFDIVWKKSNEKQRMP